MTARTAESPVFGAEARVQERAKRAKVKQPELKLVEKRESRFAFASPRAKLLAIFGASMVLLFALVAFHVVLTQGQFTLEKLEKRADQEQAKYERNRLNVAQLESPSRITKEASRLGMEPAEKVTPIAPTTQQLPRNIDGTPAPLGHVDAAENQTIMDDPGNWTRVKPELNSSAN